MTDPINSSQNGSQRDASIFQTKRDGRPDNFIPGWYGESTSEFMAEAYNKAANVVVEHRRELSTHGDTAFWPAGLLHRHAIELVIKELIIRLQQLHGVAAESLPKGHDLKALWDTLHPLLVDEDEVQESWHDDVDALVNDFDAIDKRGDAFRYAYPLQAKGAEKPKLHLSSIPGPANIDHFSDSCNRVFRQLNGTLTGVNHAIHTLEEYQCDSGY